MIPKWLTHPLIRGMDINDPCTTILRLQIIQRKPFLRKIYEEWYTSEIAALPDEREPVLEIGSGPGFLERYLPNLITSDILFLPNVRLVLDGQRLPFLDQTLGSIVFTDVLHHLPKPYDFLLEAARCVRPNGVLVMHEPWVTPWSRFIYKWFHHEPFEPNIERIEFSTNGPLSGANSAIPWILFERDQERFEREFPTWRIHTIQLGTPFRYILSGGVSLRVSMPGWSYPIFHALEQVLKPWMKSLAMFALIVLERTHVPI